MCSGDAKHVGVTASDVHCQDRLVVLKNSQLSTLIEIFNVGWHIVKEVRSLSMRMHVFDVASRWREDIDNTFLHT